eukprot:6183915-Pleurochrysis_carterae.AAC.1
MKQEGRARAEQRTDRERCSGIIPMTHKSINSSHIHPLIQWHMNLKAQPHAAAKVRNELCPCRCKRASTETSTNGQRGRSYKQYDAH